MKKFYYLSMLFLATLFYAQSTSIYNAYVILNTNSGGNTYTRLSSFNGSNLGTFTNSQSLVFAGGQNKTVKCNGGNVTGGNTYYRVYLSSGTPGSFTQLPMGFVSDDTGAGSGCQNQTWEINNNTTNILTSLANGTYTLEIYHDAPGSPSTAFYSNFGNNYKATFVINNPTLGTADAKKANTKSVVANGKLLSPIKGNIEISLIDANGRIVKTMKVNNNGTPIDLTVTQKGLYYVKVSQGNQSDVVKFTN